MLDKEYQTIHRTMDKLAELADRLDGRNLGVKPITKQQTADELWKLRNELRTMLDYRAELFSNC